MSILPKSPGEMGAPNTITSVDDPATSTNNALIGYDNTIVDANSTTPGGFKKMLTPNTYERYSVPTGTTDVDFFMNIGRVDYVALAAHNLGTQGVSITISLRTFASVFTEIYSAIPENNDALMISVPIELQDDTTSLVRIQFTTATTGASLGVVYAGIALEMQRSIYGGHSPADLSQKTSYQSTMSESGQFLGRTVTRRGSQTSFSWKHLEPVWYRDNFQPFVQSAVTKPFFIMWKPSLYPLATSYGFTTGDIKPSNMGGGNDLMSVSFNFKGHSD